MSGRQGKPNNGSPAPNSPLCVLWKAFDLIYCDESSPERKF